MEYVNSQSQDDVKSIRYGRFNSAYNGCGWIAVYNVLLTLGKKIPKESVASQMSKGLKLGGLFGTSLDEVLKALKYYGVKYEVCKVPQQFDYYVTRATCCILYYGKPSLERHYVYLEHLGMGKCRFVNPTCEAQTIAQYMKKYRAVNPVLIMI